MARVVVRDPAGERVVELSATTTVFGRGSDCGVVLADKECSRQHFQIERAEAGFKLVDLESRNGTRVNGKTVNQHLLQTGDRVEIGKSVVVFESPEGGVAQAVPAAVATEEPAAKAPKADRRVGTIMAVGRHSAARFRRRNGSMAPFVATGAVLVALGVAVYVGLGGPQNQGPEASGRRQFELALKMESSEPAQALAHYEQIKPEAGEWYKKAQTRIPALREYLGGGEHRDVGPDREDFDRIRMLHETEPSRFDEIIRRSEEFKTRWPGSVLLPRVDDILQQARARRAEIRRREVEEMEADVARALDLNEFRAALAQAGRVYEQYKLDIELKQRIERQSARILEAGKRWFQKRSAEADRSVAEGRPEEARKIYADIVLALGDGAIGEFEDEVKVARVKFEALGR